jgi:hypothetical protein
MQPSKPKPMSPSTRPVVPWNKGTFVGPKVQSRLLVGDMRAGLEAILRKENCHSGTNLTPPQAGRQEENQPGRGRPAAGLGPASGQPRQQPS